MAKTSKIIDEIDLTVESDDNVADEDEVETDITSISSDSEVADPKDVKLIERRVGKPPVLFSKAILDMSSEEKILKRNESGADAENESSLDGSHSKEDPDELDEVNDGLLTAQEDESSSTLSDYDTESDETMSSDNSRIVVNDWGDFDGLIEPIVTSNEDKEATIAEDYDLAMKAFARNRLDEAFNRFYELSQNELLMQYQIENFETFDWSKAKKEFNPKNISKIKQYCFAVHKNLAKFTRDPTENYLHALSIKPNDKSLWFEFGVESTKRLNVSAAEFAFKEFGNNVKSWTLLLRACFISKKFDKCIEYLQKIFASNPENTIAKVIKSEIKKTNQCWAKIIDGIFPEPGFGLGPIKKHSVNKMDYVTVLSDLKELAENSKQFISSPRPDPTPIGVRLGSSMTYEDLAITICDLFDRIEAFSDFSEAKIVFLKERPKKVKNLNERAMTKSQKLNSSVQSIIVNTFTNNGVQLSKEQQLDSCAQSVLDDAFVKNGLFEAVEMDGEPGPSSLKQLRLAEISMEYEPKSSMEEAIDVYSAVDSILDQVITKEISVATSKKPKSAKSNKPLGIPKKSGRRTNRVLVELFNNQVNYEPVQKKRSWEMSDYLFVESSDEDTIEPPKSKLQFPSTRQLVNTAPNKPMNHLNKNAPPISIEPFINQLVSYNKHWLIGNVLFEFCKFVAIDYQKKFRLKVEQKKLFIQVYNRWANAFCTPCSLQYSDITKTTIHEFAAELGSVCGQQVCMQMLGAPDSFDQLVKNQIVKENNSIDFTEPAAVIKFPSLDEELKKATIRISNYNGEDEMDECDDNESIIEPAEKINMKMFNRNSNEIPSAYEVLKNLCEKIQQEDEIILDNVL